MARKNKNLGLLNLYVTHVDDTARKAAAYLIYVIDQRKEKAIREAMDRRFLWFKPMTRTEAEKHINRSPTPHDCYIPNWFAEEFHLGTCHTLIETCIYLRERNYARMSVDLETMNKLSEFAFLYDHAIPARLRDERMRRVSYSPLSEVIQKKSDVLTKKLKPRASGD